MVTVAFVKDSFPSLSSILYSTGVGSKVNPGAGVNVIAPVVGFTSHVPSPGSVKLVTFPSAFVTTLVAVPVGTKLTCVGSTAPSGSVSIVIPVSVPSITSSVT